MTAGESTLATAKQSQDDSQHNSTPNVGVGGLDLGDPRCRERIEKYKEERRMFLRDKYRSESFRGVLAKTEDESEQALLARLKQRAAKPSIHWPSDIERALCHSTFPVGQLCKRSRNFSLTICLH